MSRRALRRISTGLDLSTHLKTFDDLPRPWQAGALFAAADAPLEVEVGSGKGMFLLDASQQFPRTNYLGVEIAANYAKFAASRLAKRGIDNALVVHADALRVLRDVLPEASVAAVHVYFPDPWWKARHKKRRVMNAQFVGQVQRVLAIDGSLHFWTDVEEYFHTGLEIIAAHSQLVGPIEVPQPPAEHAMDYRTNFERRVRLAGGRVYRARFDKPRDVSAESVFLG